MASPKSLPQTMRAWQFTNTVPTLEANLTLNHIAPLPSGALSLQPDQVLVRVYAAALNPVDFKFAEIPWLGRIITGSPSTPGIDFAGSVVDCGNQASDLKIGQHVFGRLDTPTKFGTLAEYTIAPRKGCIALPEGVSFVDAAAAASVALTAYQSIAPKIKRDGERVFLNGGSSGCGTFGIQIAKQLKCHVTISCSTTNVQLCRSLGADDVIDYTKQDVISELQNMAPFDLVVDYVGEPENLYWATPSFTNPTAPYMQVGAIAVSPSFILGNMFKSMWPGWLGGGKRPWEFMALNSNVKDYTLLGQWLQEGKLHSVIDEVFDFQDDGLRRAYQKVRTGRVKGKVAVKFDSNLSVANFLAIAFVEKGQMNLTTPLSEAAGSIHKPRQDV